MVYLLLAIFCAAGTTLILKAVANRGIGVPTLNFFYRVGMGLSAVLGLVFSFTLQEVPSLFAATWQFILPGIMLLYFAGITAMNAVSGGHVGIAAVVIRSSMILPVSFSLLIVYLADADQFFHILPWVCLGCLLILLSLACLAMESRGVTSIAVKKSWPAWVVGAFFAQGLWDTVVVISAGLSTRETLFCYYFTSLGAVLLSTVKVKIKINRCQWPLIAAGLCAGFLALLVSLVRPLAVKSLDGLIVIPAFAIGSMLLVQLCGSILWKHRVGRVGWLGIALSSLGILLLVFHTK